MDFERTPWFETREPIPWRVYGAGVAMIMLGAMAHGTPFAPIIVSLGATIFCIGGIVHSRRGHPDSPFFGVYTPGSVVMTIVFGLLTLAAVADYIRSF